MNKKQVEAYLPKAIEALKVCKIAENGQITKTFRGQISSFGAAVSMGSFKAAVAFFSADGEAKTERSNLIKALWNVTQNEDEKVSDICKVIIESKEPETSEYKEKFLNASVALKLAMNVYDLI